MSVLRFIRLFLPGKCGIMVVMNKIFGSVDAGSAFTSAITDVLSATKSCDLSQYTTLVQPTVSLTGDTYLLSFCAVPCSAGGYIGLSVRIDRISAGGASVGSSVVTLIFGRRTMTVTVHHSSVLDVTVLAPKRDLGADVRYSYGEQVKPVATYQDSLMNWCTGYDSRHGVDMTGIMATVCAFVPAKLAGLPKGYGTFDSVEGVL